MLEKSDFGNFSAAFKYVGIQGATTNWKKQDVSTDMKKTDVKKKQTWKLFQRRLWPFTSENEEYIINV